MNLEVPDKPYPVKLGDKKKFLQQEAFELDRSLHWLINKILGDWVSRKIEERKPKG